MLEEQTPQRVRIGVLCALIGALCWGFSGTCAQLLMNTYGVPPEWITAVRMLCTALIYLIAALIVDRERLLGLMHDPRSLLTIAAFAIFGVLFMQLTYLEAIHYTGAGVGTTLEQIGLIFIMVYACITTKRRPLKRELCAIFLAFLGLGIVACQGEIGRLVISGEGLTWGLLNAFCFFLYTVIPVQTIKKWGSLLVTGFAMLIGGVASSAFVQPWATPVDLSFNVIMALAAIILVGTCAAYSLYLKGISYAGPIKAGLLASAEPISATVLSSLWLQSPTSIWDILGCAVIVLMIVLISVPKA